MKKILLAVIVTVMLASAIAVASAPATDSLSVFFADKAKYSEKKSPDFAFDAGDFKRVVGYLQADKTSVAFIRGYATKDEGYKQADFHRRLNNMSAGDYRASYFIDLITNELSWLKGRVHFLPAVVDTVRGVRFWAEPTGLASAEEVAKAINDLGEVFGARVGELASADSALDARVSDLERAEMMRKLREALAADTRWIRSGAGVAGVSFPGYKASFVTPVVQLDFRLGERFTAHTIGGAWQTHSTPNLFGGLLTATLGYRVGKSIELNAGYTLASEFNSDFQLGWRADCATAGLAFKKGLGHGIEIRPHMSALYAGSNTWGIIGGATIVF